MIHLRGDIRKNMISGGQAGEGENVFGQESMTGNAICVLVRRPDSKGACKIKFFDIGNNLTRENKLNLISAYSSIKGIMDDQWLEIKPDQYGDWLDQRNPHFEDYIAIGCKQSKNSKRIFENHSQGVKTNRDSWCLNASKRLLAKNVEKTIDKFNDELIRWDKENRIESVKTKQRRLQSIDDFVDNDPTKIKWTHGLKRQLEKGKPINATDGQMVVCADRTFSKQWLYFGRRLNECRYQLSKIFPNGSADNRVIVTSGRGSRSGFSTLMVNTIPNITIVESAQCFPFWLYEDSTRTNKTADLGFDEGKTALKRRHAISEFALKRFQQSYPSESVTRQDIFHYIYGILHSEDYRTRYRANLVRELARIPCVRCTKDYRAFRDAGQRLGEIHVGYEKVDPYPVELEFGNHDQLADDQNTYRVVKMKHPRHGDKRDSSVVIYNRRIKIRNIPPEAWEYVVNGKPALKWVMDRQCIKTDKASGIVNDANRYAIETVKNPRYPLDLFCRIITVSLETNRIVRSLPKLQTEES